MHEAIAFHIEGLKEDGLPIPQLRSSASGIGLTSVEAIGELIEVAFS